MIVLGLASAAHMTQVWKAVVIGSLGVGIGAASIWLGTRRTGLWITSTGIKVRNVITDFDIAWDEIRGFRIGRHKLLPAVCLIDLVDGSSRYVFAIEVSNWSMGDPDAPERKIVSELNELLEERRGGTVQGGPENGR